MQRQEILIQGDLRVILFKSLVQGNDLNTLFTKVSESYPQNAEAKIVFPNSEADLPNLLQNYDTFFRKGGFETVYVEISKFSERSYYGIGLYLFLGNAQVRLNTVPEKIVSVSFGDLLSVRGVDISLNVKSNQGKMYALCFVDNSYEKVKRQFKDFFKVEALNEEGGKRTIKYDEEALNYFFEELTLEQYKEFLTDQKLQHRLVSRNRNQAVAETIAVLMDKIYFNYDLEDVIEPPGPNWVEIWAFSKIKRLIESYVNFIRSGQDYQTHSRVAGEMMEVGYAAGMDRSIEWLPWNNIDDGYIIGRGALTPEGKRTGIWVFTFPDTNKVFVTGRYDENGHKTGTWIFRYRNGYEREVTYFDGKEEGLANLYEGSSRTSSDLKEEVMYHHGKRFSSYSSWYGYPLRPNVKAMYDENGLLGGHWKKGNMNTKTSIVGQYEDGKRTGKWTFNNYSGEKFAEGHYLDGKRTGVWKIWELFGGPNKPLVREIEYNNGEIIRDVKF